MKQKQLINFPSGFSQIPPRGLGESCWRITPYVLTFSGAWGNVVVRMTWANVIPVISIILSEQHYLSQWIRWSHENKRNIGVLPVWNFGKMSSSTLPMVRNRCIMFDDVCLSRQSQGQSPKLSEWACNDRSLIGHLSATYRLRWERENWLLAQVADKNDAFTIWFSVQVTLPTKIFDDAIPTCWDCFPVYRLLSATFW